MLRSFRSAAVAVVEGSTLFYDVNVLAVPIFVDLPSAVPLGAAVKLLVANAVAHLAAVIIDCDTKMRKINIWIQSVTS